MLARWDLGAALAELRRNAVIEPLFHPRHGWCARFTRLAIVAGFGGEAAEPDVPHNPPATFIATLQAAGYTSQGVNAVGFEAGDVAVILPYGSHKWGHVAMFDGNNWISDFVQLGAWSGIYPNDAYRRAAPPYEIFRAPRAGPSRRRSEHHDAGLDTERPASIPNKPTKRY
jgi:hypothetical protein